VYTPATGDHDLISFLT